jgi:hypothetical protein
MKTSELQGAALDWAVAKCEAERLTVPYGGKSFLDGVVVHPDYNKFYPSTNWAQGGPIIESEGISLYLDTNNLWQANIFDGNPAVFGTGVEGSTPLIAAMRCYVASKLGDEVDVPEELL